jgi:hypothetical protein
MSDLLTYCYDLALGFEYTIDAATSFMLSRMIRRARSFFDIMDARPRTIPLLHSRRSRKPLLPSRASTASIQQCNRHNSGYLCDCLLLDS